MSTEDGFNPDHPLPLFLSDHAREPEERGLLLLLNAIILLMTVILIGIAIALLIVWVPTVFVAWLVSAVLQRSAGKR